VSAIPLSYNDNLFLLADRFRNQPYFVCLDSGHPSGPDLITSTPIVWIEKNESGTILYKNLKDNSSYDMAPSSTDLLQLITDLHGRLIKNPADPWQPSIMGSVAFEAGYDYNFIQGVSGSDSKPTDYNSFQFGLYSWALVANHEFETLSLVISNNCPDWLAQRIQTLIATPIYSQDTFELMAPFKKLMSKENYLLNLSKIDRYIQLGDCYQVNYTQRLTAPYCGDPWLAFKKIRNTVKTPFSVYFDADSEQLLSHSPERFLKVTNNHVETKPIKGTRKRSSDLTEDLRLANELENSAKDRAENVMIVDLLRNDLGRTAVPGSVRVPALFRLESYQNVHHLVSTVTATLNDQFHAFDCFLQAFPGGSITGAPKKRAMEVIHELEPHERGPYCGSFFYWDASNKFDSNIMIRTLVTKDNMMSVWGGGGIVADSIATEEYEESLVKIENLIQILEDGL